MADSSEVEKLQKLLKVAGTDGILEYRNQIIPPEVLEVEEDYFSVPNASQWISLPDFRPWFSQYLQRKAGKPVTTVPPKASTPDSTSNARPSTAMSTSTSKSTASNIVDISNNDSDPQPSMLVPVMPTATNRSRKRKANAQAVIDLSDDEAPALSTKKARTKDTWPIQITRQSGADKLVTLTDFPDSWTSGQGEQIAFLLDLRKDTRVWPLDSNGKEMSMAAKIKQEDQDSWGGGTAGTTQRHLCPDISTFGDVAPVKVQVAHHFCGGSYICSHFDMSMLENLERYASDLEQRKAFFDAERAQNELEGSSPAAMAAIFYQEVHSRPCRIEGCDGVPVIRPMKKANFDAKSNFIGCSAWNGDSRHRFDTIPRNINEEMVKELFRNNGEYPADVMATNRTRLGVGECKHIVRPQNGARGKKECPYTHFNLDNKSVKGKMIHRKCPAEIYIYSPLKREDRRAIVVVTGYHNHPMFPPQKLSSGSKGKAAYIAAAENFGPVGLTVSKLDAALSHRNEPQAGLLDPALLDARKKRKIIRDVKTEQNGGPDTDIKGVRSLLESDLKLPPDQRYVHRIITESTGGQLTELIITMKRVGDPVWKEWEIVGWCTRLNMRLTIGWVYMTRETTHSFYLAWSNLWSVVKDITGCEVKFEFLHGEGIISILVDGSKPQIEGCGLALLELNNRLPPNQRLPIDDPLEIVKYIVRVCLVHLDRNFDKFSESLTAEDNAYIRSIRSIRTQDELDRYAKWCQNHENKKVKDWWADKDKVHWFVPCINEFFTKMSLENWYNSPSDTNLNESAHPYTNIFTGILLRLLEAIQAARLLDFDVATRRKLADSHHVLPNHRNTVAQRLHKNTLRKASKARKTDAQLSAISSTSLEDGTVVKVPKAKKRRLQHGQAIRGKSIMSDPAYENLEDLSDNENEDVPSSPPVIPLETPEPVPSWLELTTPMQFNHDSDMVDDTDAYGYGPYLGEIDENLKQALNNFLDMYPE
ncbi:hypothetical protein C8J56DRAFT_879820 [Mycena floridula]|nr:hypothetical protein C8J56DRAFT_879820 [Mycena floridula]